jgi:hypothetical protein
MPGREELKEWIGAEEAAAGKDGTTPHYQRFQAMASAAHVIALRAASAVACGRSPRQAWRLKSFQVGRHQFPRRWRRPGKGAESDASAAT